jgi:hypothetical protein
MTGVGGELGAQGNTAGGQYALELYVPRFGRDAVPEAAERAGAMAERMAREGAAVAFLRSVFLPRDEICFLLFESPSAAEIAELARRAAISYERVLEVTTAVNEHARPRRGGRDGARGAPPNADGVNGSAEGGEKSR